MSAAETKSLILDKESVRRKMGRMALEIAERNTGEKEIVLAGIVGNGEVVAKCIAAELRQITAMATNIILVTINLDKKALRDVAIEPRIAVADKVIILVDDVANTGKTMFFALKPFLQEAPKKLQTLVLVERSHKLFPIQTDYAGLTLATTLQEHIAVETEGEEITGALLF